MIYAFVHGYCCLNGNFFTKRRS